MAHYVVIKEGRMTVSSPNPTNIQHKICVWKIIIVLYLNFFLNGDFGSIGRFQNSLILLIKVTCFCMFFPLLHIWKCSQ